jgi:hypothetical protein
MEELMLAGVVLPDHLKLYHLKLLDSQQGNQHGTQQGNQQGKAANLMEQHVVATAEDRLKAIEQEVLRWKMENVGNKSYPSPQIVAAEGDALVNTVVTYVRTSVLLIFF